MTDKNTVEMRMYLDIQDFHQKFQLTSYNSISKMPDDLLSFREKFLVEEATETYNAMLRKDSPEALDGLVDLAYVALGTFYLAGGSITLVSRHERRGELGLMALGDMSKGVTLDKSFSELGRLLNITFNCRVAAQKLGWFFDTAWDRVHEANMSKTRALSDKDGKRGSTWDVVKPEGWVAPVLSDLV